MLFNLIYAAIAASLIYIFFRYFFVSIVLTITIFVLKTYLKILYKLYDLGKR